jgi:hypothetical protein
MFYNHDCYSVIIEDGRDILGREFVRCVRDEQTSFAYSAVSDDHALDSLHLGVRFANNTQNATQTASCL